MFCSEFRSRPTAASAIRAVAFLFVAVAVFCGSGTGAAHAQSVAPPPGFAAAPTFVNSAYVASIRDVVPLPNAQHLVMTQRVVWEAHATFAPTPGAQRRVLEFTHEDIAFVDATDSDVLAGGVASGRIVRANLASGQVALYAMGVKNAFDAVRLATGDLLLSANPTWPASGSNSGIWLVGPGRTPRELLRLVGPSGPLLLDAAGDLIVGELGPIVPPPPGAARLLRIPALRIQQALAGGSLTMADVSAIGAGFNGIYDLAAAPDGRLFASDPASSLVHVTNSGGLSPVAAWCDVGAGRYVTHLHWSGVAGAAAPFAAFAPPEHSQALSLWCSDYVAAGELLRIAPQRPTVDVSPSTTLPPGPATLEFVVGPANGLALWFASAATTAPEQPLLLFPGAPVWLGVDLTSVLVLAIATTDATGASAAPWANPGGASLSLTLQALAIGAQPGVHGTTAPLALQLLP